MSEGTPNPYETPQAGGGGGGNRELAASQLAAPAIGLMVVSAIHLVISVLSLFLGILGMGMAAAQGEGWAAVASSPVWNLVGIAIMGLIFFGALKMKSLQMYGLAMASAILSCIPCFCSPCIILGIPFGIWAIVILIKPEVKAAFTN